MKPQATSRVGADVQGQMTIRENILVDERQLLLRHCSGDREAFGRLVAEYRAPVWSYLVRSGVAESDREDLFQDIFIKIHAASTRYEPDRPLHPWLFTIVANTVRTYRRKRRVRELIFREPSAHEPEAPGVDGERALAAKQAVSWLERAIPRLPSAQREVLILTCIERLNQKDVAAVLGIPVNTVKTQLRRARQALVRGLARRNRRAGGEVPS